MARFLVTGPDSAARSAGGVAGKRALPRSARARAQTDKARSDRDRVYAGVRRAGAGFATRDRKGTGGTCQAAQDLVRKTVLAARSDASQQELDLATAAEARDRADIDVAEAQYAEAQRGPTAEERALADATVAAALAAQGVIEARAAKMLLRAPSSGRVAILVAEVGEAVVPGEAVLTVVPDNGLWFGFNLREDALHGIAVGSSVPVRASGLPEVINAKVVGMRNLGEFATWRAAGASGDHDLNTFFRRLDPVGPVRDLTACQTVRLTPGVGPAR